MMSAKFNHFVIFTKTQNKYDDISFRYMEFLKCDAK